MTHDELVATIKECGRRRREEAIRRLLSGNDTCCFTTAQFSKEMYPERAFFVDDYERRIARKHLENAKMTEVSPDVWTLPALEQQGGGK